LHIFNALEWLFALKIRVSLVRTRVEAPSFKPLQKCEGFFDPGGWKHRHTLTCPCGCAARCNPGSRHHYSESQS